MQPTNSVLVNPIPAEVGEENIANTFSNFGKVIGVKRVNPCDYAYCEITKRTAAVVTYDPVVNCHDVISRFSTSSLDGWAQHAEIRLLEDIQQESKLFIGMIPQFTTEEELQSLLGVYGDTVEVVIIKHGDRIAKGYGFCRYSQRCAAIRAIREMSGKTYLHNATIPLVVKFADTPKQKQARLQRHIQTKGTPTSEQRTEPPPTESAPEWSPLVERDVPTPAPSSFWMDFSFFNSAFDSFFCSLSNRKCVRREDITQSEYYEMNTVTNNEACIHIFNFHEEMTAEAIFNCCKSFGSVVDVVIVSRFPFCYGRIECISKQEATAVYSKLNDSMVSHWRDW